MEIINISNSCEAVKNLTAPVQTHQYFDIDNALQVIFKTFLDESVSEFSINKFIVNFLHPQGAFCPNCNAPLSERTKKSFYNLKRCRCNACGKFFSATQNTILHGAHNVRAVFLVAILTALNVDIKQISELTSLCAEAIKIWQKKFRGVSI